MRDIGLFDGTFMHQVSCGLGGDLNGEGSRNIRWMRGQHLPITFYTDTNLELAIDKPSDERSIAWLLEPRCFSETHYENAERMLEHGYFQYVITHEYYLAMNFPGFLWCPVGGAWVYSDPLVVKSENISMIISELRLEIKKAIEEVGLPVDFWGRGVKPMKSKDEALKPYRFSIVVESCKIDGYFTEKLIDCFLSRTVPLYWGDNTISQIFNPGGMFELSADFEFHSINELLELIRILDTHNPIAREAHDYFYRRDHRTRLYVPRRLDVEELAAGI